MGNRSATARSPPLSDGDLVGSDSVTVRPLVGHASPVSMIKFVAPQLIATGSSNGVVIVWDVVAGVPVCAPQDFLVVPGLRDIVPLAAASQALRSGSAARADQAIFVAVSDQYLYLVCRNGQLLGRRVRFASVAGVQSVAGRRVTDLDLADSSEHGSGTATADASDAEDSAAGAEQQQQQQQQQQQATPQVPAPPAGDGAPVSPKQAHQQQSRHRRRHQHQHHHHHHGRRASERRADAGDGVAPMKHVVGGDDVFWAMNEDGVGVAIDTAGLLYPFIVDERELAATATTAPAAGSPGGRASMSATRPASVSGGAAAASKFGFLFSLGQRSAVCVRVRHNEAYCLTVGDTPGFLYSTRVTLPSVQHGHEGPLYFAQRADRAHVVLMYADGSVILCTADASLKVRTELRIAVYFRPGWRVFCSSLMLVAVSPNGQRMLSCDLSARVRPGAAVHDRSGAQHAHQQQLPTESELHGGAPQGSTPSASATASGRAGTGGAAAQPSTVYLYDVADADVNPVSVFDVAFLDRGRFVTGHAEGPWVKWEKSEARTSDRAQVYDGHLSSIVALCAVSLEGLSIVVTASADGDLLMWMDTDALRHLWLSSWLSATFTGGSSVTYPRRHAHSSAGASAGSLGGSAASSSASTPVRRSRPGHPPSPLPL